MGQALNMLDVNSTHAEDRTCVEGLFVSMPTNW